MDLQNFFTSFVHFKENKQLKMRNGKNRIVLINDLIMKSAMQI